MLKKNFFEGFIPTILTVLRKAFSFKKVVIYLLVIVVVLAVYIGIVNAPGQSMGNDLMVAEEVTPTPASYLSEKELFDAINNMREQNLVNPLRYEPSTCALAKASVEEVYEEGVPIFNNPAAFQRTIDRVMQDPSFDHQRVPDFYRKFLTYDESVGDAIDNWNQNGGNPLFMELDYQVGCVAEKEGYAVVVVGFDDPRRAKQKTDSNTTNYTNKPKKGEASII